MKLKINGYEIEGSAKEISTILSEKKPVVRRRPKMIQEKASILNYKLDNLCLEYDLPVEKIRNVLYTQHHPRQSTLEMVMQFDKIVKKHKVSLPKAASARMKDLRKLV
jgi:hypothetical protein